MAKAKSLITKIEGYKCNVCGVELIGVSEQEALAHVSAPKDRRFRIGFGYLSYANKDKGYKVVRVVEGSGVLSQEKDGQGVHGYLQEVMSYSINDNNKVIEDAKNIEGPRLSNTKRIRANFMGGISRLLTAKEARILRKAHNGPIRTTDPSLEARTK